MAEPEQPKGFAARRLGGGKGLKVETAATRKQIAIEKRIEKLKPGVTFESLYTPQKTIHDGGQQCRILKVNEKSTGTEYVVKVQAKHRIRGANEAMFRRMTERMMNLPQNINVVKVHDCFEDQTYFYTLLEACEGGDLFDFFRMYLSDDLDAKTLEDEVRVVTKEILISLKHLHDQGLVHKDVKLENLVFKQQGGMKMVGSGPKKQQAPASPSPDSPKLLKLVDFDFTEEWEPSSPKSKAVVGTDGYIAPEAYLGDNSPKTDIFSTGIVMYVLIAGRFPYDDDIFDDGPNENYVGSPKMKEIYDKLKTYKVRYSRVWDEMPLALAFVKKLIHFDPDKRLSATDALADPWIKMGEPAK